MFHFWVRNHPLPPPQEGNCGSSPLSLTLPQRGRGHSLVRSSARCRPAVGVVCIRVMQQVKYTVADIGVRWQSAQAISNRIQYTFNRSPIKLFEERTGKRKIPHHPSGNKTLSTRAPTVNLKSHTTTDHYDSLTV
jgi:hypothetical protein